VSAALFEPAKLTTARATGTAQTGRKEDLHGHECTCFNPRADALIGATILGIVRHATDWEGLLQNQRRDQAPPGAWHWEQRHLSHAACFIPMSGFNREAKNV